MKHKLMAYIDKTNKIVEAKQQLAAYPAVEARNPVKFISNRVTEMELGNYRYAEKATDTFPISMPTRKIASTIFSNYLAAEPEKTTDDFFFLGLRPLTACNLKCIFCDQPHVTSSVSHERWLQVIDEVSQTPGTVFSISGGEPTLMPKFTFAMIREIRRLGGTVNLNTNATLLNEKTAFDLVAANPNTVHISLDSANPAVHNLLEPSNNPKRRGSYDTFAHVLEGIEMINKAKQELGTKNPVLFFTMVGTKYNLQGYDELCRMIFTDPRIYGLIQDGEYLGNFVPHISPVGGDDNKNLYPSSEDWDKFWNETLPRAEKHWLEFQHKHHVPEAQITSLKDSTFFSLRAYRDKPGFTEQKFLEYLKNRTFAEHALAPHCYLAHKQAYITSDGTVYHCGSHADVPGAPTMGNIMNEDISTMLKRYAESNQHLPGPACANCYGATLNLNKRIHDQLWDISEGTKYKSTVTVPGSI